MRILLDTHVFLWFISGNSRIPAKYRQAIQLPANDVYLSVVSMWETSIKQSLGKIQFPSSPGSYLSRERQRHKIAPLPLQEEAVAHLDRLPTIHRDPFDRVLACQAIEHQLIVATVDAVFSQYPVQVLPY
jgi:PIN domain nuclease of toxin-antitoxin system